ncbi:MAG: hypothetical protein ACRDJC_09700 [Thermomicrobiales bacterium]
MDGARFDDWTRRRFGRAIGATLAALVGLSAEGEVGMTRRKKRRRKDRCQRVTEHCNRATDCCNSLVCEPVNGLSGNRCCRLLRTACAGPQDCCGALFCNTSGECDASDSDRALKANFAAIDAVDMLERVRTLPIASWDAAVWGTTGSHVGPLPHDFAVTFGVGADDAHIHVIDGQGIVLAAIQGAARLTVELHAESASLRARLDALE